MIKIQGEIDLVCSFVVHSYVSTNACVSRWLLPSLWILHVVRNMAIALLSTLCESYIYPGKYFVAFLCHQRSLLGRPLVYISLA
jgi:hypothetical protein